jgi:hypothetical protein
MRRLIKTSAIMLTCISLSIPQLDARGRNNGSGNDNGHRTEQNRPMQNQQRPGSNNRPSRPSNGHNNKRPDNNGHNGHNGNKRPGNINFSPGNNSRPHHPQWNNSHKPDKVK